MRVTIPGGKEALFTVSRISCLSRLWIRSRGVPA